MRGGAELLRAFRPPSPLCGSVRVIAPATPFEPRLVGNKKSTRTAFLRDKLRPGIGSAVTGLVRFFSAFSMLPASPGSADGTTSGGAASRLSGRFFTACWVAAYFFAWWGFFHVQRALLLRAMQALSRAGGSVPDSIGALDFTSPPVLLTLFGSKLVLLAGAVALTCVFGLYLNRCPLSVFGLQRVPGWMGDWAMGVGVGSAHMGCVVLLGLLGGYYQVVGRAGPLVALTVFGVSLAIALPSAAFEEITMRGYVLQTLARRFGPHVAVAVSSLCFALMHWDSRGGHGKLAIAGLVVAGGYFAIAQFATRQLWLPISLHTTWNMVEGPVFGLPVSGFVLPYSALRIQAHGPTFLTGGDFGPEAGVPLIVVTLLWSGGLWLFTRRRRRRFVELSCSYGPATPEPTTCGSQSARHSVDDA